MPSTLVKLQEKLLDAYPDLEIIRKKSKLYSDIATFSMILGVIAYITLLVGMGSQLKGFGWIFLGFFGLIAYIFIVHYLTIKRLDYKKYFDSIKGHYISTLLQHIDPAFEYIDGPVPLEDVLQTGLFSKKWVSDKTLQGEDYFRGSYKGVSVQISEVDFGYGEIRKVDSFKKSVLVILDFNKNILSETYVYDRDFNRDDDSALVVVSRLKGTEIVLENPEFEAQFQTTTVDEIEGRYILTHSFMEKLLELKKLMGKSGIYVSFLHQKVSVLIYNRLIFEPSLKMPVNEENPFARFHRETLSILKIVDVLKLNEKIWT